MDLVQSGLLHSPCVPVFGVPHPKFHLHPQCLAVSDYGSFQMGGQGQSHTMQNFQVLHRQFLHLRCLCTPVPDLGGVEVAVDTYVELRGNIIANSINKCYQCHVPGQGGA
jgi:hypothetical protein